VTIDNGASSADDRAVVNGAASVSAVPASVPSADLAHILYRAAQLLEPEGAWTQGAFSRNADGSIDFGGDDGDPDGVAIKPACWCMLGAIAAAAGFDLTRSEFPIRGPLKDVTNVLRDVVGCDPADWNDEPNRLQEEVVANLRVAAQTIEAQPAQATQP
jgi:hypothetical protein